MNGVYCLVCCVVGVDTAGAVGALHNPLAGAVVGSQRNSKVRKVQCKSFKESLCLERSFLGQRSILRIATCRS